jgi:uroporphyrinogen decarboxylase
MTSRRQFLTGAAALAAPAFLRGAEISSRERVDRVLRGDDTDRPPFSFWHHFLDKDKPGEAHARVTLDFHRRFRTDLVKVMSDYDYPKPAGAWYEAKVVENPFPRQIRALELIRDGLGGDAYFLETIFNPYKVAENLSSPAAVRELKDKNPQKLLDALEAIAKSEANHAKRAAQAGAAGMFLAIANAEPQVMSEADYAKFSEPFDRIVLRAVEGLPLNTLHLHGDKVYLDRFWKGWPPVAINYSTFTTGVPMSDARAKFAGVLMGGIDEVNYRGLSPSDLKRQWGEAQQQVGRGFILAPGCSVPNDSTDSELSRLPEVLGA